ncbi:MAG: histidine--tRNA ligase [Gemmatimonadota bacterium]|nr:histidine--tRNA ligase [Gemmatimonadota bacterium]
MAIRALPGFRDFYPAELSERAYIIDTWRTVARRFGFVEYDGPPLEPLELYTLKSGDEIVGQLYTFDDKGGRAVALRPEMTPTLARMVSARASALRKPVRWFAVPQLFRYERQQRGRLREHFQLNLDIIGEADVTADAELLAAGIEMMRAFGLTQVDVHARVSDRPLLNGLLRLVGVDDARLPLVYGVVDKFGREPRSVLEERLRAGGLDETVCRRVFEVVSHDELEPLRAEFGDAPELRDDLARLASYFEHLDALGVAEWVHFDLSVVRGLAYYTGIVFELFDVKGELRAIAGGGRYDSLLGALGGVELPALGFGMGDVVLAELLRDRELIPPATATLDYWVAGDDDASLTTVMRVATALRRRGLRVEYALRPQKLGKQLKAAVSAGAGKVVIIRDAAAGTVRRLSDGAERAADLRLLDGVRPPDRNGGAELEDPFPFPQDAGSEN